MKADKKNRKYTMILMVLTVILIVVMAVIFKNNVVNEGQNIKNTSTAKTTQTTAATTTSRFDSDDWRSYLIDAKTITMDEKNWFLTLLSRYHKLPDDYAPKTAPAIQGTKVELDHRVASYYQKMYDAGKRDGVMLTPYSGYRSISFQKRIYEQRIEMFEDKGYRGDEAKSRAAMVILPPGTSEHNMGIAMDIVNTKTAFENTAEFNWLCENAADYGFILRYPKDKTEITKIVYEPWHWRYVGIEAAKEMKASKQCLEEYLGKI
jgi:D-alanyl-D-alanine carboxypeptidase